MTTTIRKWGNSYAVRLPKKAVEEAQLREGQTVIVSADEQQGLTITRTTRADAPLKELAARITKANRHSSEEWGAPVGKEAW